MVQLKDVLIHVSSNVWVHQTLDIIVVDILESYGVIPSRDWSVEPNRYLTWDRYHLSLSYKGQPNKIKVE